jgi:hypothetical protein
MTRSQKDNMSERGSPIRKKKKKEYRTGEGSVAGGSMGGYSQYSKNLYNSIDITNQKRAHSAKPINIHGLRYKFKVVDLGKYRDSLKYGTFNWPVQYCTVGKKIPNPEQRKNTLVKEIHFDTLLRVLRQTDWSKAPIYQQFIKFGRWKHDDEKYYSEIEIKYLISSLTKMASDDKYEEFSKNEGIAIIEKHWEKTVTTLQALMNQMNMMYFYEKLKVKITELTKNGRKPSLIHLEKVMSRCLKLYQMIDNFMKIFNLIKQKEVSEIIYF